MNEDLIHQNEEKLLKHPIGKNPEIKAYKRRWLIMLIFVYYACNNGIQWIEYSTINNKVVKYYNVSSVAVDWTSTIFMALYPLLVIPAAYITDKKGLRAAGLIGCIGNLVACTVKVFSIRTDLFWVVLLGQVIATVAQMVIVCLPSKLAATWFKASEVSTACSLGVFGTQMGNALAFIISPFIVHESNNPEIIGTQLKTLCWFLAGSMVPVTIAVLVYFPKQPPLPPSTAQAILKQNREEFDTKAFFRSIKLLFCNKGFVIHMIAYSINMGVFSGIGTLLNQFILYYFEGATEDAGWMGFIMIVSGMIGSIIFGIILDKTHKYKEVTLFVYVGSVLAVTFLMFTLKYKMKIMTYIACSLVGTFTNAYTPVGFELAIELTYPAEESTMCGILYASTQILSSLFTVTLGFINQSFEPFWSLGTQAVMLFIGVIVTAYIPKNLRRQQASKQDSIKDEGRKMSSQN